MSTVVRAIDVGFGNTKYVTASAGGKVDCAHFPSLAFYSPVEATTDRLGGRIKTLCVPVEGLFYEVGPDIELAADRFRARQLHDAYTETPEYRALTAGALYFMKEDVIDLLVVGLPVAQFLARRKALEQALTGTIEVGRRRRVTVRKVLVLAQPQGALFNYAAGTGKLSDVMVQKSLVMDVGSRTFDWLVTRGMQVVVKMSHSVNRGVWDVVRVIAAAISKQIGEDYRDFEAIDLALRTGKSPRIYQKAFDLKPFDVLTQKVADEAVSSMLEQLDNSYAFDNIVLVGGGAFLFKKAVKRQFPKHSIHEVREPIYANVRGFQLAGEQFIRESRPPAEKTTPTPADLLPSDGAVGTKET